MYKWFVKNLKENILEIGKSLKIHPVLVRLMINRKIPEDQMLDFLSPESGEFSHDPFLMKDMDKACDLLVKHIDNNSSIRIVGDYDQDGNSATLTLLDGLLFFTDNLSYAIPDRQKDGYGISAKIVETAKLDGVELMITCDNGISAKKEIEQAKALGMDVIVTDHHMVPVIDEVEDLPKADAILNPKQEDCNYPFKELCGAGVAYKLVQGLFYKLDGDLDYLKDLLEYVAMGTICDIVDLVDENRYFVVEGLKKINSTENYGMKALKRECGVEGDVTVYTIGFIMGPCINAAGRLDSATKGIELFLNENMDTVDALAKELVALNNERKDLTEEGYQKVDDYLVSQSSLPSVLVLKEESIHESIVGIIAGRIKEKYNRPTILFTRSQDEGILKGSGRSIEEYNMYERVNEHKKLLVSFGGHSMAAGMSIEESEFYNFEKNLVDDANLTSKDLQKKIYLDSSLNIESLSFDLIEEIEKLAPFGKGNPKPLFGDKNVHLEKVELIGKNKNVLKLQVSKGNKRMIGICFNEVTEKMEYLLKKLGPKEMERLRIGVRSNHRIDIVYYPQINEFRNKKNLQLLISDLR